MLQSLHVGAFEVYGTSGAVSFRLRSRSLEYWLRNGYRSSVLLLLSLLEDI